MANDPIFVPFKIKNVEFKNRIIRSSIGGRTAFYTGEVNPAWTNFESTFAKNDVSGIISATITVDEKRWSPLEYPKLSHDRFVDRMRRGIAAVKEASIKATGAECRYIVQLGDGGYHTQASLFTQRPDSMSASSVFDLLFGYRNRSAAMGPAEIRQSVEHFANAARRAKDVGSDGIEITASKGYLIHQFLNPATNRRMDKYGGSVDKRFRFLREIVTAVQERVDFDDRFILGIRLSARDYNYLPFPNVRLPFAGGWKGYWFGNDLEQTLYYARELEELGVDYLHISNGFGFINPHENPGDFPVEELRMFMNSVRHLTGKAKMRSMLLNILPLWLVRAIYGWGWESDPAKVPHANNADDAAEFKRAVGIAVIGNGGFQSRADIESSLRNGKCDMVSMARSLLANPHLVKELRENVEPRRVPCTFCNRCAVRTTLFPLGCYDLRRYLPKGTDRGSANPEVLAEATCEMEKEILRFNRPPP